MSPALRRAVGALEPGDHRGHPLILGLSARLPPPERAPRLLLERLRVPVGEDEDLAAANSLIALE